MPSAQAVFDPALAVALDLGARSDTAGAALHAALNIDAAAVKKSTAPREVHVIPIECHVGARARSE